jgi:hypothetical protein
MGGNALKNTETIRFDRLEYLSIKNEVLSLLRTYFKNRKIDDITCCRIIQA